MNSPSTTPPREIRQRDAALFAEDAALLAENVDRLLDQHLTQPAEQPAPSSGFTHAVMESIHAQASAPPPLVFPWRTLLAGVAAIACGLIALIIYAVRAGSNLEHNFEAALQPYLTLALSMTTGQITLCWIWLATLISITAVAAAFQLTGHSE